MKKLWLLRHAKASVGGAGIADRDRPLNARGRDAAERVGRHLATRGARFDLVLCSSALRTRETIERVEKGYGAPLAVEFEDGLYLANERALVARIARLPEGADSVVVVGHNPGIEELALQLAVRGDPDDLEAMRHKFPTGALAELRLARWSQVSRGGELIRFVTPKRIPDRRD